MKTKIFAITVSVLTFLSSLGWASELEKNELDEVVTFAKTLGVYDCYDFEGAYRHPKMNQVYSVGEHSIYNIVCILGASNFGTVWFQRLGQGPLKPIYFATTPVSGFSKDKKRLDILSGVINWRFHDLRRSFATHSTEKLGISPVIADKILNHVTGQVRGVAAIYQHGESLKERRDALQQWGDFIEDLVSDEKET